MQIKKRRVVPLKCFHNRITMFNKKIIVLFFVIVSLTCYSQNKTAEKYLEQGNAKYNLQDYRGAIQDFNKAIEINPQLAEAYLNRGNAKDDLQDYSGAIQDYNKAIEINPQLAEAYLNRGNAKYRLNDKSGACLDWSKAGELGHMRAYDNIKLFCNSK